MQGFGQRIKALREARSETLEQVAAGVGTAKSYVWELENKKTNRVSLDSAAKFADHFGLTLDEIAGRTVSATGKILIRGADGAEQTFNIIETRT